MKDGTTLGYSAIDRYRERRTFKTLKGAQRFAQKWVGETPELAPTYAISSDGIGKIQASIPVLDLFPILKIADDEIKLDQLEDRRYWEAKIEAERMSPEHLAEYKAETAWLRHAELGHLEDTDPRIY